MNEKTKIIKLTLEEYENFRAVAERFNVKFNVNRKFDTYDVEAPEDELIRWGYLENYDDLKE